MAPEPYWTNDPGMQQGLLVAGVLLSAVLWYSTWTWMTSFWSICWRTYITVILTAGVPWFGGNDPAYILFWTLFFEPQESVFSGQGIEGFLILTGIYWVGYMPCVLAVRAAADWFNE